MNQSTGDRCSSPIYADRDYSRLQALIEDIETVKKEGNTHMTVAETFEQMQTLFNPSAASGMNKTLQWNITGAEAGKYALQIANQKCELIPGGIEKPDMTLTVSDQDWLKIAQGQLDPVSAFMTGKVKVAGDMSLAMRLAQIFPRN